MGTKRKEYLIEKEREKISLIKKFLPEITGLNELTAKLKTVGIGESDPHTYMSERAEYFNDIGFVRRG